MSNAITNVAAISALNGRTRRLSVGARVPAGNRLFHTEFTRAFSQTDTPEQPYVVQKGDTLWDICERTLAATGSSPTDSGIWRAVQEVAPSNGLVDPDLIVPGQEIDLSTLTPEAEPTQGENIKVAVKGWRRLANLFTPAAGQSSSPKKAGRVTGVADSASLAKYADSASPWSALLEGPGRLTSPFGIRRDPFTGALRQHDGLDIAAAPGTPIYPLMPGQVTFSGWQKGYGQVVIVQHPNGLETVYGHTSENLASVGQGVEKDTPIGKVGSTGRSTGPHLHFEVRSQGRPVDPLHLLTRESVPQVA